MNKHTKIMSRLLVSVVVLACLGLSSAASKHPDKWIHKLEEDNWELMLKGEWMVEFYAPWCPACKALEPIWENFAYAKRELNIEVGKVDATDAPGLSGRFMVTALPTIYHVKNGVFRQYKSPRDKDSLMKFINQKTWEKVDPIPSWKSPTSIQMSIVSQFFRMSQMLRSLHNKLMEDLGLPSWGSYLIFAVATIFVGAFLGLLIVCIIDFIYPPKNMYRTKKKEKSNDDKDALSEEKNDEDLVDNVKDDLVDENDDDESEEKSDSEKTDNENGKETDKDQVKPNSPNSGARKRRPPKAD